MKIEQTKLPEDIPLLKRMLCFKNGEVIIRPVSHFAFACPVAKGLELLRLGLNPPLQAIPYLEPNEFIILDESGKTHIIESTEHQVMDYYDNS